MLIVLTIFWPLKLILSLSIGGTYLFKSFLQSRGSLSISPRNFYSFKYSTR